MTVAHREVNEEQKVEEAMMQINAEGGDSGTQRIQLLAPLNDESTIAKFIDRNGPGLQQLAFRVTDVEAVSATLRERGLRLLYDAPKRGTANSRINFVHPKDAGGVLVELVEPAADHRALRRPAHSRPPRVTRRVTSFGARIDPIDTDQEPLTCSTFSTRSPPKPPPRSSPVSPSPSPTGP